MILKEGRIMKGCVCSQESLPYRPAPPSPNKVAKQMDDDEQFENYTQRSEATLAYRLMEYLEFLGVITDEHVNYLRWPPIELIEDAEAALKDER
jgi:hypothetical protein